MTEASAVRPADGASALGWLAGVAAEREAAGLRRRLVARGPEPSMLDLSGNDYLGLSRHPAVVAAAAAAAQRWGAGSTGSRLVSGTTTLHEELEAALAAFTGLETALVFSSGYLANLGALTSLAPAGSLVVADAVNHASLIDAARLARADVVVVPHLDVDAVAVALAGRTQQHAVVVTDAVFSVDGEAAPLAALHRAAREHGAALLVDDAHGLGVVGQGGRGSALEAGIAGEPDVVITATLSKSLGSQGGVVLGPQAVRAHVIDHARSFIFDTGLNPAAAGAALEAVELLLAEPWRAEEVRRGAFALHAAAVAAGWHPPVPDAAVVAVPVGGPGAAVAAQRVCAEHGLVVGCFRPPSVPDGVSRLRLGGRADLTASDVDRVREALAHAHQEQE